MGKTGKTRDPGDANAAGEISRLISAYGEGDRDALEQVLPLLCSQLETLAEAAPQPAHVRPTDQSPVKFGKTRGTRLWPEGESGREFHAIAGHALRQLIVDYARQQLKPGRRQGVTRKLRAQASRITDFNRQLERLGRQEPRLVKVVECRLFAGLNHAETAASLNVSTRTVQRDWRRARTLLAGISGPDSRPD